MYLLNSFSCKISVRCCLPLSAASTKMSSSDLLSPTTSFPYIYRNLKYCRILYNGVFKLNGLNLGVSIDVYEKWSSTGLQITVRHRTMSDQIWQMSKQNQILIGHNVRPNKIYCLMKKFCFIMLKEKLLFLTKKAVRFLS